MAIHRTPAIVIGRRELGESDRLVDFYTREFGKLRGVAKAARRMRSRFGSALELFTLGELVFFDSGRSQLVRVDHFDIVKPFVGLRERLERLGQGAWAIECVARLSADRDPHPALFRLLLRDLRALEGSGGRPGFRCASRFGLSIFSATARASMTDASPVAAPTRSRRPSSILRWVASSARSAILVRTPCLSRVPSWVSYQAEGPAMGEALRLTLAPVPRP